MGISTKISFVKTLRPFDDSKSHTTLTLTNLIATYIINQHVISITIQNLFDNHCIEATNMDKFDRLKKIIRVNYTLS